MSSPFILNGVCVKWIGWIDLHTLNGKAKLVYDAENAAVSYVVIAGMIHAAAVLLLGRR